MSTAMRFGKTVATNVDGGHGDGVFAAVCVCFYARHLKNRRSCDMIRYDTVDLRALKS